MEGVCRRVNETGGCVEESVARHSCRREKGIYARMCFVTAIYARMCFVTAIYARMCFVTPIYARMCFVTAIYARMCFVTAIYGRYKSCSFVSLSR